MIWSLGWEDLLEKEMATYSSNLAWRIPWTEEPNRLQSMGSQKVGHNWATNSFTTYEVLWCVLTISCPLCFSQRKVRSCHSRVLNMWFPLISSLPLLPVYSCFPSFHLMYFLLWDFSFDTLYLPGGLGYELSWHLTLTQPWCISQCLQLPDF